MSALDIENHDPGDEHRAHSGDEQATPNVSSAVARALEVLTEEWASTREIRARLTDHRRSDAERHLSYDALQLRLQRLVKLGVGEARWRRGIAAKREDARVREYRRAPT